MKSANDIRKTIIEALCKKPVLGQNYVDWHDADGNCCVTILYPDQRFDITIRPAEKE